MKQQKLLIFALAAMGVTACTNDVEDVVEVGQEQALPLTITVDERPLINPDTPGQTPGTRAAIITTPSLTEFTLDYQYVRGDEFQSGQNNATKDGSGNWSAGAWPDTGGNTEVGWYAHTGGTLVNQSDPYLSFRVDELATNQKDLLVATATGTKNGTGGNLSFTFDHACTALCFYVKKSTNLNDYTLAVTDIKVCNIANQGKYYFGTSSQDAYWTTGETRSQYTIYSGSAMELGSTDYIALDPTDAPFLFMVPQTLTAWDTTSAIAAATTQSYIRLDCTLSKNSGGVTTFSGTAYIPLAATFMAGYQHDVKINIGKNSLYSGPNTKIIQ